MGRAVAVVVFSILLLFAGCIGESPQDGAPSGITSPPPGSFSFPASPVDYTATYKVSEGAAETVKKVWASGSSMRMDLIAPEGGFVSFYFLKDRAYSCARFSGKASCFEVTPKIQGVPGNTLPCQSLEGAQFVEEVDIGNTKGKCYLVPMAAFSKRKICCTDRGVLAYDEYNVTAGNARVEYLTDIIYETHELDFVLPAEPKEAPD